MQALKDADFRLPMDTFLGARFRDAGFVTIGKTNTPELGILPTTEPDAYGATHNPWDPEHTPGGSSGGSGGRGRGRDRPGRPRQRRRRLDPDPGQPQRPGRPEADPPAHHRRAR